jgi:hypothetical protein
MEQIDVRHSGGGGRGLEGGLSGGGSSWSGGHETVSDGDLGPRRRSVDGIGQTAVNLEAPADAGGRTGHTKDQTTWPKYIAPPLPLRGEI